MTDLRTPEIDPQMPGEKPLTPTEQRTLDWLGECGEHFGPVLEFDRGRYVWVPHGEYVYTSYTSFGAAADALTEANERPDPMGDLEATFGVSAVHAAKDQEIMRLHEEIAFLRNTITALTTDQGETS